MSGDGTYETKAEFSELEYRVARALCAVVAAPPASDGREFPVLDLDPDFDDMAHDHTQGTADDPITQVAVLRLARAAINEVLASDQVCVVAKEWSGARVALVAAHDPKTALTRLLMRRDLCVGLVLFVASLALLVLFGFTGSRDGVYAAGSAMPFILGWLIGRLSNDH